MRIGVLRDTTIVNSLYRVVIPMDALERRGHEIVADAKSDTAFDVRALQRCDVVYVHRYWDPPMVKLLSQLRRAGVAIWWDNDDDISAVPRGSLMYKKVGGARGAAIVAGMKRAMQLADLVTTPSAVLAERYRASGASRVDVLENCIPDHFPDAASRPRKGRDVVIGWTAGLEHELDRDALDLVETLTRLLDAHPGVQVVATGLNLGLRHDRYRHVPRVNLGELAEHNATYDVGIAPLADIAMNQARSNVKVKEYASAGVPWLASPVGPYLGLGEREGGRLVPDDRWFEELERMVVDERGRRGLAKRATKWGKSTTIGRNVDAWEAALQDVVASARLRATA